MIFLNTTLITKELLIVHDSTLFLSSGSACNLPRTRCNRKSTNSSKDANKRKNNSEIQCQQLINYIIKQSI